MEKNIYVLGIMSGTSLDGIDYTLTHIKNGKVSFIRTVSKKMPPDLRKKLTSAIVDSTSVSELAKTIEQYSKHIAMQVQQIKLKYGWKIDLVGVHGQTIFHSPRNFSWQIFEPSYLSQKLNVPVVFNFRNGDIASGGEGAPLAPLFHKQLASQNKLSSCAFLNLGGIANITVIEKNKIVAFDTGPANTLIDIWLKKHTKHNFDKSGAIAKSGKTCNDCLKKLLKDKYFTQKPPKSTGREYFNEKYILKNTCSSFKKHPLSKQVATLTEFTARTVAESILKTSKATTDLFICGGGTNNLFLIDRIRNLLPNVSLQNTDALGWPTQSIEGGAFAFMAYQAYLGKASNTAPITGATKTKVMLGQISYP